MNRHLITSASIKGGLMAVMPLLLLPCTLLATGDRIDERAGVRVSRTENVSGAFGSLSLDALAEKIVNNKQQQNADIVKRLHEQRTDATRNMRHYREQLKAMHANPERLHRLASKVSPITYSRQAYMEMNHREARLKHETAIRNLETARRQGVDLERCNQNYNKATKAVGSVGKALSVVDAYQNAYVDDGTGKKTFSGTRFATKTVMNLTGISGLSSAYTQASEVKERAFLRNLDALEKAGMDITDPRVINMALYDATGQALLVGAYEGAKCVPLAGDAINIYELSEASIGLVYDTLESQRMRAEGASEREGQVRDEALPSLQAMVRDLEAGRTLFAQQQQAVRAVLEAYRKTKNQYLEIETRAAERTDAQQSLHAQEKACAIAAPFTQDHYLDNLKRTSRRYEQALKASISLAGHTLTSHLEGRADASLVQQARKELVAMMQELEACQAECKKALDILSQVTGGGDADGALSPLQAAAVSDAEAYQIRTAQAAQLAESYAAIVTRCQGIMETQQHIGQAFDRAFDYFSIRAPDDATSRAMIQLKNNAITAMIKPYEYEALLPALAMFEDDLQASARPLPVAGPMEETAIAVIRKAGLIRPELGGLSRELEARLQEARTMLARIDKSGNQQRLAQEEAERRAAEQRRREAGERERVERERWRREQEQREQTIQAGDVKVIKPAPPPVQQKQEPEGDIEWKIEKYRDGSIKVKTPFLRRTGQMHGTSTSYYTNGQIQETLTYANGVLNGPHARYYQNGTRMSQTQYSNGKEQGRRLSYHDNGNISQDYNVVDGNFHGPFKVFYPDGKLQNEGVMDRGSRDWIKVYNQNGDLIGEYRKEWGN
jgi:hypothetical protein